MSKRNEGPKNNDLGDRIPLLKQTSKQSLCILQKYPSLKQRKNILLNNVENH